MKPQRNLILTRAMSLVAALGMLNGCALGPDYKRPELPVPDNYRWQDRAAGETTLGDLGWWQVYSDPQLQEILNTAVAANLDVRIAAARVEQARATLGSTRLQFLPNISAEAGATRAKSSAYAILAEQDRIGEIDNAALNVSYELDIWGRLRRSTETARAQLLATEYAQRAVLVGLVADVASAYFKLISFDEQLTVTRNTVATRQKFVELTRAKHDRGVVSGLDVSTAEAELATAQANIPDLEREIAQTENQLSILLGQNPEAIARARRYDDDGPLLPMPPVGLPSALLERRPDLRRAEQNLIAANAQIGAAKAALFPTISLTGVLGSRSLELSQLFTGPAETWLAGVNLVQPLLDAEKNIYQVDFARAGKREALLLYQQAVQNAFKEVADALIARQKFAELQFAQETKVAALRRANQIALARYQVGYSSYFDVINSNRDLFNAELSLATAYLNSLLSSVQLYQALGGGWQSGDQRAAAAR
ncbi:MAG TPA: efflux transporter outer membrane subunit [Spongiibacteraceae bacterium]|nr:efflux transporter outer membrane subunit [Spongiibacteraceae bacterium]